MSDPTKSLTPTTGDTTLKTTLQNPLTPIGGISIPKSLRQRMASPQIATQTDPLTRDNRIALLLDGSGSMHGDRNARLHEACMSFVSACDFTNTSVAVECFGAEVRQPLTCFEPLLMTTVMSIPAKDGTPLADAMAYALTQWPITRAVCVSDGQPDNQQACYDLASQYGEAGITCDCVHISTDSHGEDCLRRIAELSGGCFIKFSDIGSFAKSFKYLTPGYYGQLTSGSISAAQLGAKEIK